MGGVRSSHVEQLNATQRKRKNFRSQGLTFRGEVRTNKSHPELSGLSGASYHLSYIRLQRMKAKAKKIRTESQSRSPDGKDLRPSSALRKA